MPEKPKDNCFLEKYSVKQLFEKGEEADAIFKLVSLKKGRYK